MNKFEDRDKYPIIDFDVDQSKEWTEDDCSTAIVGKPSFIQAVIDINGGSNIAALNAIFPNKVVGTDKILGQNMSDGELRIVQRVLYPPMKDAPETPNMQAGKFDISRTADIIERYCDISIFTTRAEDPSHMLMNYDGLRFKGCEKSVYFAATYLSGRKIDKVKANQVCFAMRSNLKNYAYIEDFPDHSHIANFMNGVVDISGGEIVKRDPSRSDMFSSVIPNEYFPNLRSDIYDEYLKYTLDEKYHQFLYEWIGYLFFETYHMQKFIIHIGKGGNGKGINDKIVGRAIGQMNQSNVPLSALVAGGYDTKHLRGKLRNVMPEIDYRDMKNGGVILNQLSSNTDVVHAQVKYGEALEFINFARLEMTGNNLPQRFHEQTGFDRRLLQVEWMQPVSLEDWGYYSDSKTGLFTQESINGLISTAVDAYFRVMQMDVPRFSYNPSADEVSDRYDIVSDPLQCFVDQRMVVQENQKVGVLVYITNQNMYNEYEDFCKDNDLEILSEKKFFHSRNMPATLKKNGMSRGKMKVEGIEYRVWFGAEIMD